MIRDLWLYPPLAFARVGMSDVPADNYAWGPNDVRPRGTGKTTAVPAETLRVADDGTVTAELPAELHFKDAAGWRPVCPFFELHASWEEGGAARSGPVTAELLEAHGLSLSDVRWSVHVANLKPFHMTLDEGDRLEARLEVGGGETSRRQLEGRTPGGVAEPLVAPDCFIGLGWIQATRPSGDFPALRLRFTPPPGVVYGPEDLAQRPAGRDIPVPADLVPADRLVINPRAAWPRFQLEDDPRTNPQGLFAIDGKRVSLGLVDDVSDGFVSCTVGDMAPARARIVVGPPNYAPDRRPFTTLADGLKDRVDREEVHAPAYVDDMEATTHEVRDLMERVFETMGLVNVDYQNARARAENRAIAEAQGLPAADGEDKAFPRLEPLDDRPLPWTEIGRQQHERFLALEVFEDVLRERSDVIELWIREPGTQERYYDRRMPALYRGSDRYPMHLTRRQYELLQAWAARLRRDTESGT